MLAASQAGVKCVGGQTPDLIGV
eukprot:COSAG03_NODE_26444_length_259_cov_0.643750_1_plen_22_part_10